MKKWNCVLKNWENGTHLEKPDNIKKPFMWRTSVINHKLDLPYKEESTEDIRLDSKKRQDISAFKEHFSKCKNKDKDVIHFFNLSKDTILVVPTPKKGKNFKNIFYFMKNASKKQQKELWMLVSKQAKKMLKKYDNIWISTHGLGVDYLHIRICCIPKYYEKSKLRLLPTSLK